MRTLQQIYIEGAFVTPHGDELFDLHNPSTEAVIGRVRLGDVEDARAAIAAAKHALPAWSATGKAERIAVLHRLHDAMKARHADLLAAIIEEYGAPSGRLEWMAAMAAQSFLEAAETLETYEFHQTIGRAEVVMQPLGVVAAITPWNSNASFICSKMATAIAAGCTVVIKPSEMSALQTQVVMEALHEAGVPKGLYNIVTGRGDVVGAEFSSHRDVAKVTFTGSTAVGRTILRAASETMKRVTLELGGKSPQIILDDADIDAILPAVVGAGFMNSGQACVAGTRVLVPESRMAEFLPKLKAAVEAVRVGDPNDTATDVGPMVSQRQFERVQGYIRLAQEEGATLLTGGEGRPEGLDHGWFVRPTIFADADNDMRFVREEIFGPVLAVIPYAEEEQAIRIANDTDYGLQAYVLSSDVDRARRVAARIEAGRVHINGAPHEPQAPFGGFKQSGIGRERGVFGLEAHMEPKAVLV
ncbi:aldehyde dehydrogenase family protein [Brevundimonas sp. GCM10030266]|uniref:aldehyde dehydrogenase family protein n=1 Tax=Brevundimonas sp. GCM10030266 TaxID=3273386 RepID=UPI0036229A07